MVNINLYLDDGSYRSDNDTVKVNKQVYEKDRSFEKVEYTITYGKSFNEWNSPWNIWSNSSYHVYIVPKRDKSYIFKYTVKNNEHVVRKVESYHSKKHPNFPLIIGFQRDEPPDFRYYSFTYLTRKGYYTGFPKDEVYGPSELHNILKEQDKRVNKISYSSRKVNKSHISKKQEDVLYNGYTKHNYFLDNSNRYESHDLTKEKLFEKEKNNNINDSFIGERYLDDISIYYHNESGLTIFVEFTDDSGKKHEYIRKDEDGYYWTEHKITQTEPSLFSQELEKIRPQIHNQISYMLEKNCGQYGKKNITVLCNESSNQYKLYTHKTSNIESITKTFVIYNNRAITLVDNNSLQENEKLKPDTIQKSIFTEIETHSLEDKPNEHLLIKLTDRNTHYYLQRCSKDGSKWRQLSKEELKDEGIITENESVTRGDGHMKKIMADRVIKNFLDWISLEFRESLVILLNKKDKEGYTNSDIEVAFSNLEPRKDFNAINLNGKIIKVFDKTSKDGKCIDSYCYKVLVHDITEASKFLSDSSVFRFLIPSDTSATNFKHITLYTTFTSGSMKVDYMSYKKGNNSVYVYFYGNEDPRPLMICYNGGAYCPKDNKNYFGEWVKSKEVTKWLCNRDISGKNDKLIGELTRVMGFLNQVELQKHPKGAGESPRQTTCPTGGQGKNTECQGAVSNNLCTYEVHQFQGQPIQVKVTCEPVTTTTGSSCYRKLTHQPIGMNGVNNNVANGFRLGDVVHISDKFKIDYYGNDLVNHNVSNTNKYNPLTSVVAYFYNEDREYCDPLLVVLEFATNGGRDTYKVYYKLIQTEVSFEWLNYTDEAASKVSSYDTLVKYLDSIRYCLKYVFKVELQHNGTNGKSYPLKGRAGKDRTGQFTQISGAGTVNVTVEECPALSTNNYKCVKHNLSTALAGKHHLVTGMALVIPQNLPEQSTASSSIPYQEISLYNIKSHEETVKEKISNGTSFNGIKSDLEKYTPIYYESCMGDLYVYFYVGTKTEESTSEDPRPVLLCLNNKAYRPLQLPKYNGDHYPYTGNDYTNWVKVREITSCGCDQREQETINDMVTTIYLVSSQNSITQPQTLDSIMKFLHEHVVELSGGAGGLVGLIGIIVGGILVFKKVTAASAAATVAAAAATAAAL